MVREIPEIHVERGDSPKHALSVCAVRLGEHVLHNGASLGESVDESAFEGLSADVALSWNADGLCVALSQNGRGVSGEAAAVADGRVARAAFKDGRTVVPWSLLAKNGAPPAELGLVLDLAWDGLDTKALKAMPRDVRAGYVHTSMSALTARPGFQFNPHLPNPSSWGRVVFGVDKSGDAAADDRGLVSDFTWIGCGAGTREVDGDLGEWPGDAFSAAAMLPSVIGGRYSAEFALSRDGDALFIAARISSPDGVPSNSAAAETGAGYGGGDALQFRISPDGAAKRSFCAWMSPSGPALTIDTDNPAERDIIARGGRLAFGREDGFCTMEASVPWDVLGARPADGDEWRMTFQPWWNAPSDRFTFFGALRLENPPAKTVRAALPKHGAVSLGVFDGEGRLVRTLLKGDWLDGDALSVPWDLKDQWGGFVPPGEYVLKGIVTGGIQAKYECSVLNPGTPAWPTADGRGDWLSDEAPPQGAATDGTNVFLAAPGSEKGFAVMAIGPDGKRIWGVGEEFYPRCVSLSYLGGVLYALWSGPVKDASPEQKVTQENARDFARGRAVITAYDAKTGRRVGFSAKNPRTEIGARWPYREDASSLPSLIAGKSFAPSNYIGQPRYWDQDIGETDNAIGFAALPGLFAVSRLYDGRIEFYDASTLEKTGEVEVAEPAGLCRAGDASLLAISGRRVVRIDCGSLRAVTCEDVVSAGLSAPVSLCLDRDGNIYVSDWAGEMCVKKFSPDGTPLGVIGKHGGRPWIGAFEKDGMLLPHGLAVTDAGTLFVAEADMLPKRVSAWDAADGRFLRHWIGPAPYGGMSGFWVDPDEPGFFHASGCKFSWDMESGAWDIAATEVRRMSDDQPFVPNAASCMAVGSRLVKRGGETFLVAARRNETVWLRRTGDFFTPCAAVGGLHSMVTDDGTGVVCWDSDIGRHLYRNRRPPCFKGHSGKRERAGDNFSWSDSNGDGLVQPEEMEWCETLTRGDPLAAMDAGGAKEGCQCEFYNGWGAIPAPDGTLHFAGFAKDGDCIWRIIPERWTEFGPVYDISSARTVHREAGDSNQFSGVWTDRDGSVFATGSYGHRGVKARAALYALAPDGTARWEWAAPNAQGETDAAASGVNGEWEIPAIGRILCAWNWWWNYRPYLFTDDGLYVGTFGEVTSLGPAALWGESATYFFQDKDGRPFIVNGANQAAHVFSIGGLDDARRFEGTVSVSEADIAAAKDNVVAAARRPPPKMPIRLDGAPVAADGGAGRGWRIALSAPFGADSLRVVADVDDPTPMLQAGGDPRTLFITGDCVDVMLAADPGAPRGRRAPALGDKRLLLSEMDGKGVAVLFEPVVEPRAERPERLMACEIDRITVLERANVEIKRREGGYSLAAEVPLADIGLAAGDPRTIWGDVGVVFSGASGGRELRLYHYNMDTAMTSDLTTEATLQPREWGKILRPQGANLIEDPTFGTGASPFPVETEDHVSIGQTIRLPEGRDRAARLRLLMRAEGLKPEDRNAEGKPGAWIAVWAFFKDAAGKILSQGVVYRRETDAWDWTPCVREARHDRLDADDAIILEVPDGAETVRIDLKLTTRGQTVPARVWIDGAEFSVLEDR